MSVYIKGMKMPKRCFECPAIETIDGLYCSITDKDLRKEHGINLTRPDWCPLRPLPEKHGRLIDADAMKALWAGAKIEGDIGCLLDVRPTIIPAEEGEA